VKELQTKLATTGRKIQKAKQKKHKKKKKNTGGTVEDVGTPRKKEFRG